MKIYIDVTNLMHVNFLSGIQRVVREVVLRLLKKPDMDLVLLQYNQSEDGFMRLDNSRFEAFFERGEGEKKDITTTSLIRAKQFEPGSILLEMDSIWNIPCNRLVLYPELKARGVKIACFYQDIIPVMWPQYAADTTVAAFLGYLTAVVTYADMFLSSTQTNIDYLKEFMKQVGVDREVPCLVTWLGMDFGKKQNTKPASEEIKTLAEQGKYLLMVGTIEPRKNQSLVIDAMERGLFEEGYRLIIAGRLGWNVEAVEKRIRNHPEYGKKLIWLEQATDGDIDELYKKGTYAVFPSFTEGFGLPIVEAFQRGLPVLSSNHPVMQEVGGEFCRYFDPYDADSLVKLVKDTDLETYGKCKERIKEYPFVTWDTVADRVAAAMEDLNKDRLSEEKKTELREATTKVKQMVILSARSEDFLRSVPFVERFMSFIEEIVLCCPEKMKQEVQAQYEGRLKMIFLTDDEVLAGEPLPEDHAKRNIFLRARAIAKDIIDPVFLMGDDDYRPLQEITLDTFYENGKQILYYVKDLRDWKGAQGGKTSFDYSMVKCAEFLQDNKLSTFMFDAHMPQIICKELWLETIEIFPGIVEGDASEWSGYLNFLLTTSPGFVELRPYATLNWPGYMQDWDKEIVRDTYLFENFYDGVYEEENPYGGAGHFLGFAKEYHPDIEEENKKKIEISKALELRHEKQKELFASWQKAYAKDKGYYPVFAVVNTGKGLDIRLPESMPMLAGDFMRVQFDVEDGDWPKDGWQIVHSIYKDEQLVMPMGSGRIISYEPTAEIYIAAPKEKGEYMVQWTIYTQKKYYQTMMKLLVE